MQRLDQSRSRYIYYQCLSSTYLYVCGHYIIKTSNFWVTPPLASGSLDIPTVGLTVHITEWIPPLVTGHITIPDVLVDLSVEWIDAGTEFVPTDITTVNFSTRDVTSNTLTGVTILPPGLSIIPHLVMFIDTDGFVWVTEGWSQTCQGQKEK